jgi:hypothetical protein
MLRCPDPRIFSNRTYQAPGHLLRRADRKEERMTGRMGATLALAGLVVAASMGMAVAEEGGEEIVTAADCDLAIKETARGYERGRRVRHPVEQLARECTTIAYSEPLGAVSSPYTQPSQAGSTEQAALVAGTICRSVTDGRAYYNAFGNEIVRFQGHLRACGNRSQTTGGGFWMTVNRCCNWFYEGVVQQSQGGCFNGCAFVSRYRMGSFVFNPPWPTITTRLQPWFRLRVNADGTASHSSGD